jgi:cytoskeletal protein RodZ
VSSTFRALAWSDADDIPEPMPADRDDPGYPSEYEPLDPRPQLAFTDRDGDADDAAVTPPPWYRRPVAMLALGVIALAAVLGAALYVLRDDETAGPTPPATSSTTTAPPTSDVPAPSQEQPPATQVPEPQAPQRTVIEQAPPAPAVTVTEEAPPVTEEAPPSTETPPPAPTTTEPPAPTTVTETSPPPSTRPPIIPTLPYQTIPGLPFVPAPIQPPQP